MMNRDLSVVIDDILARTDIVALISEYVPLKRAGANYKACCPFHNEKTPSFMVSPAKQIYHCFGCGVGGNAIGFLMKYKNVSFMEALQMLGGKAGVEIPEINRTRASGKELSKKKILEKIYVEAVNFYKSALFSDSGKTANRYISGRLSDELINEFDLGYSPPKGDSLFSHLSKKGFKSSDIYSSNLCNLSADGYVYDFFRNRIMFPIFNVKGIPVGFGGRAIDGSEPKYINTPESNFFKKRYELYNLDKAREYIGRNGGKVVVVEGYMDVISLWGAGVKNVVAPLGTSLTDGQLRVLKRYGEYLTLMFDGDSAGVKAALRALPVILKEGLYADIVILPDKEDPDTFVGKYGKDRLKEFLNNGKELFDFYLDAVLKENNPEMPYGLNKINDSVLLLLKNVENRVILNNYIKRYAQKLKIDELSIRKEFEKREKREKLREREIDISGKPRDIEKNFEEIALLRIVVEDNTFAEPLFKLMSKNDFLRNDAKLLYEIISERRSSGKDITLNSVLSELGDEKLGEALIKASLMRMSEEDVKEDFFKRIAEMKIRNYRFMAKAFLKEKNLDEYLRIKNKIKEIQNKGIMVEI